MPDIEIVPDVIGYANVMAWGNGDSFNGFDLVCHNTTDDDYVAARNQFPSDIAAWLAADPNNQLP